MSAEDRSSGVFALVDFAVQNIGGTASLITRVNLSCPRSLEFKEISLPEATYFPMSASALESSSTTPMELPLPQEVGFSIEKKISQLVQGGEFDRFQVMIEMPRVSGRISLLYRARFELKYDSKTDPLCTDWFVLCYPDGPTFKGGNLTRKSLVRFVQDVTRVRSKIDNQRTREGLEAINWDAYTNASDSLILNLKREVEQTCQLPGHEGILADFWRPGAALDTYFEKRITQLEQLAEFLDGVERIEIGQGWRALEPDIGRVRRVLGELRKLRAELVEEITKLG